MTGSKPLPPGVLRLHWGQRRVRASKARFRVLVSGRRWGKTELDKAESAEEFGTPGLVWYIAPTFDMARDLMWEPLKSFVHREWLAREPNETRMELETIWGCRFACKSAEHPDRLRGRGPRKVICDEFQDWKDGMRTWQEVILPSLLTTNGRALFTGTPKSFNHLHALFELGQRGLAGDKKLKDWASWQFRTSEAPHITQAFLEDMRAQMDDRSYRQEFEASFEGLAGRAYYAFDRKEDVKPVELLRGLPVAVAFDFNIMPATAVIGQPAGQDARVWREVWIAHAGGEATKASAEKVQALLREQNWTGEVRIYGDPAGQAGKTTGPSDHAVVKAMFPGATWCIPRAAPHVKDRVAAVNARCRTADGRRHLMVDPSCHRLIADLEQVIFKNDGDLDKKSNELLTHISDAAGYWIHAVWPVQKPRVVVGEAYMPHLL